MIKTTKSTIRTSCPRDCYDGCGISVVLRGDTISRVAGNPDHPNHRGPLCGKCAVAYNGAWLDENSRLLYPPFALCARRGTRGASSVRSVL
ncbi:hypothetical protein [Ruegeria atlantica]|uniref:hypothetical protein n=1 Tax=Ruegeria atlantica TaxID=81569 RepID=UPI00147FD872